MSLTVVGADRLAADFHAGDKDDPMVSQLGLMSAPPLIENRIVDAQMRILRALREHVSAVGVHAGMTRDDPGPMDARRRLLAAALRSSPISTLFIFEWNLDTVGFECAQDFLSRRAPYTAIFCTVARPDV